MDTADGIIKPSLLKDIKGKPICRKLAAILQRDMRIKQHSKLWFSQRNRMITCSDMAAVLGMNPYSSKNEVFNKKTGQAKPFHGNAATRRGTELEPVAMKAYEKKSGKTTWPEDVGLMQHPVYSQIGGSPDGITLDGILVEIKCPMSRRIIPGLCPKYYIPQVQVLMEIFDLDQTHFVQYRPETRYTNEVCDITIINRDPVWFANALPQLQGFMTDVTEFYRDANMPIGTPMIEWDNNRTTNIGTGKVCAFVYDKPSNSEIFVIEAYDAGKVTRTEHKLISDVTVKDKDVEEAHNIIKNHNEDTDTTWIDSIISNLPERLKYELQHRKSESLVDYSDSDSDGNEQDIGSSSFDVISIDIEAISARMRKNTKNKNVRNSYSEMLFVS